MSEQVMRENFAAVSGDSKGSVVQNEHEQVLQKLHQDSLMSEGAKTTMMDTVIATETLTRAPFAATVARAIPPLGLSVSVLAGAGTINDAFQAVEAEEVKKESALIKEAFGPKFAPGAIAKIESECSVSTLRKAAVYGMGTLSEGLIGYGSGVVLSPFTAGYSAPVLGIGGLAAGYLNAGRYLDVKRQGCEVDKMKEQIRSW
ncbi:MAG: hypothetical protein IPI39_03430 [Candidatus Obscuribacter sp.]|nr:hypothetical protein [Candidatus Obscuribacter sp.]